MAARASFSNESSLVKMPLPKSLLLKDYLLDDLSSCSSNGFRSYPRRQCFTTVRYLIEIDLNKHMKLPPTQKQFLKSKSKAKEKPKLKSKSRSKPKSKSKSVSVLHKASAAVVNVFKHFQCSGKPRKTCFLPRNLSRKLSKHGFWKKTSNHQNKHFERLKSFDESIKEKENSLPPSSKVSTAVTTTTTSNSNSDSSASSDSYFTATSDSSTTGDSSKINVAQNDVEESKQQATEKKNTANGKKVGGATATASVESTANGNAKNEEKEQFSPVSMMDFPCDDEDEVTSPFQHSSIYVKGRKQKLMPKVRRSRIRAQLEPTRLEDKIALSESKTPYSPLESFLQNGLESDQEKYQIEKKAVALLQLLKATMSSDNLFESTITDNILLGFFIEQINQGNVSNLAILQEAKDWMNGNTRKWLESQNYKITYITDMEKKGLKWLKYDDEEVGLELEYEVFTSLVDEMLLEFYF